MGSNTNKQELSQKPASKKNKSHEKNFEKKINKENNCCFSFGWFVVIRNINIASFSYLCVCVCLRVLKAARLKAEEKEEKEEEERPPALNTRNEK